MAPSQIDIYQKVVEIFSINGEIHSSVSFLSKNELMLMLAKRNEIMRGIGFMNGNFLLIGGNIELFEDATQENVIENTNLVMAVLAPLLYEIIKNRTKQYPDFLIIVNASGRHDFLKGLVSLVHSNAAIFDKLDSIIKSIDLIGEIMKMRAYF
ncbi:MAG: hypothetical protein ABII22_05265 [Candidatus Micrarchaeota archaeon]